MPSQHETPALRVARAHVAAWSTKDWDTARSLLAPDVHVTATHTGTYPPPTDLTGADDYMTGLTAFAEPIVAGSVRELARGAVEPRVHAPHRVEPARVRRVGVIHDAVLERERAHPGPFAPVGLPVRAHDRLGPGIPGTLLVGRRPQVRHAEVVLDGPGVPRLVGVPDLEDLCWLRAGWAPAAGRCVISRLAPATSAMLRRGRGRRKRAVSSAG